MEKRQSGVILLTTLAIISALMMMGGSVVHQSVVNEKTNHNYQQYTKAFLAAEVGLMLAEQSIQAANSIDDINVIRYHNVASSLELMLLNCPHQWWSGGVLDCEGLDGGARVIAPNRFTAESPASSASFVIEYFGFTSDVLNMGETSTGFGGVHHFKVLARGTG